MIMFFFLLLMLAMAWGLLDHFQDIAARTPPAERAPTQQVAPNVAPPVGTAAGDAPADSDKPGAAEAAGSGGEAAGSGGEAAGDAPPPAGSDANSSS